MLRLSYKIDFHGSSDVGLVRKNNEDVWGAVPECRFYVLADGMGGHNAGEIAAKETVERLKKSVVPLDFEGKRQDYPIQKMALRLKETIQEVNRAIHQMSVTNELLQGMGTTLCCMYVYQDQMIYCHVGDSRIYCFNKNNEKIEQLTSDHSLVNDLIALGQLSQEDAVDFPFKNVLTRSMGTHAQIEATVNYNTIQSNDIYLMCSDGLSNFVTTNEIQEILISNLKNNCPLQEISENLINLAKQHGGGDNITVVIVKFENHYE